MPCINCKRMDSRMKDKIKAMSSAFNRSQIAAMLGVHKHEVDKVLDTPVVEPKSSKVKKDDIV